MKFPASVDILRKADTSNLSRDVTVDGGGRHRVRSRFAIMRGMDAWEYCAISVALYREGSGGGTRELLTLTLPGAHASSVTHAFGLVGLLNQLGADGWELVDVEASVFYLKRRKAVRKASRARRGA